MNIESILLFLKRHQVVFGFFACICISVFFATYALSESPKTWFDEGLYLQFARNLITQHSYAIRISPTEIIPAGLYATTGFTVFAPVAMSFYAFGIGLLQARIVMVLFIILLIAMTYIVAYRVWGFRIACISTLLIATHAPLYGNGKNVLGEVPGLFFFFLFLIQILRLEKNLGKKTLDWFLAGCTAGLFMATKPNFLLLIPVLGVVLILQRKKLLVSVKNVFAAGCGIAIPVSINMFMSFGFSSSIFSSFGAYAHMSGLQQVTGLDLSHLILRNATYFFTKATPLYCLLIILPWFVYIGIRVKRKEEIPAHEQIAAGFVCMTVLYFLKMPGFFRYLFVAQIIAFPYMCAASFMGLGIRIKNICLMLFLFLILFQSYQVMFSSFISGYYHNTRTQELTEYFQHLDPEKSVFFYHTPEAVSFFRGENYFQYFDLLYFNDGFGTDQLSHIQNGDPDIVYVAQDSVSTMKYLLTKYKQTKILDHGNYVIFERI